MIRSLLARCESSGFSMAGGALASLLQLLGPQAKPVLVAVIAIVICLLLFRPRRKPVGQQTRAGAAEGSSSKAAGRGPALCLSTVGTLIEFRERVPQLLPGAATALLRIAERTDVYLVTTLPEDSDELEAGVLCALEAGGLFGVGGCDRRKAMFCTTEDGRSAIARQLTPAVHVDTSTKVVQYLAPHLQRVVFVSASGQPPQGVPGVAVSSSLADYAAAFGRAAAAPAVRA